jgi:methylated-DNA-[protein]-cysteine S-methyltransferase
VPEYEPPDLTDAFEQARLIEVAYVLEDSPVGRLLLAGTRRGLVRVSYIQRSGQLERTLEEIATKLSPRVLEAPARLDATRRELDEFFTGRRRDFSVPLDWGLIKTGFTRRVLEATARIPFGETLSYRGVAGKAGNERAFRAAGTALGSNPLPIVVPCHRVLHTGGGLGGYTGGLEIKRVLLEIEGRGTS